VLKSFRRLVRCRSDRLLETRLAGLNPASKTLAEHAHRTEFHRSRKLIAAVRAGALGLCAHVPNRPSATTATETKTTLHRVVRNRPAQRLVYCCPVARAIACSFILARQIIFRNKIPTVGVLRRPVLITSWRRRGGSKLMALNRRLSRSP
jgi:hypothetical protein